MAELYHDLNLRLDTATAERTVEHAILRLWQLDSDSDDRIPAFTRSPTPDDEISAPRRFYREYFRNQPLDSPDLLSQTTASSRSITPEPDTPKRQDSTLSTDTRSSRDSNRRNTKSGIRKLPPRTRRIKHHPSHGMKTRSSAGRRIQFFDLDRLPSSKALKYL